MASQVLRSIFQASFFQFVVAHTLARRKTAVDHEFGPSAERGCITDQGEDTHSSLLQLLDILVANAREMPLTLCGSSLYTSRGVSPELS